MDTNLIINSTNGGKKVSKAISNINPEKDNATLKEFAQKVNALTTNNYVDATRVNKMSVEETYSGGGGKTEGVISLTSINNFDQFTVNYNGDGELFIAGPDGVGTLSGDTLTVDTFGPTSMPETGYVLAEATDNFTAAICEFHTVIN